VQERQVCRIVCLKDLEQLFPYIRCKQVLIERVQQRTRTFPRRMSIRPQAGMRTLARPGPPFWIREPILFPRYAAFTPPRACCDRWWVLTVAT